MNAGMILNGERVERRAWANVGGERIELLRVRRFRIGYWTADNGKTWGRTQRTAYNRSRGRPDHACVSVDPKPVNA